MLLKSSNEIVVFPTLLDRNMRAYSPGSALMCEKLIAAHFEYKARTYSVSYASFSILVDISYSSTDLTLLMYI